MVILSHWFVVIWHYDQIAYWIFNIGYFICIYIVKSDENNPSEIRISATFANQPDTGSSCYYEDAHWNDKNGPKYSLTRYLC